MRYTPQPKFTNKNSDRKEPNAVTRSLDPSYVFPPIGGQGAHSPDSFKSTDLSFIPYSYNDNIGSVHPRNVSLTYSSIAGQTPPDFASNQKPQSAPPNHLASSKIYDPPQPRPVDTSKLKALNHVQTQRKLHRSVTLFHVLFGSASCLSGILCLVNQQWVTGGILLLIMLAFPVVGCFSVSKNNSWSTIQAAFIINLLLFIIFLSLSVGIYLWFGKSFTTISSGGCHREHKVEDYGRARSCAHFVLLSICLIGVVIFGTVVGVVALVSLRRLVTSCKKDKKESNPKPLLKPLHSASQLSGELFNPSILSRRYPSGDRCKSLPVDGESSFSSQPYKKPNSFSFPEHTSTFHSPVAAVRHKYRTEAMDEYHNRPRQPLHVLLGSDSVYRVNSFVIPNGNNVDSQSTVFCPPRLGSTNCRRVQQGSRYAERVKAGRLDETFPNSVVIDLNSRKKSIQV